MVGCAAEEFAGCGDVFADEVDIEVDDDGEEVADENGQSVPVAYSNELGDTRKKKFSFRGFRAVVD